MRFFNRIGLTVVLTLVSIVLVVRSHDAAQTSNPLEIYFVDVEGGQATLFVTPEGESLLVDTGWAD